MIAAPGSGSGKTMITGGLLCALKKRQLNMVSFKCGPDYIDPMFHAKISGKKCYNLDSFLGDRETVKYLFHKNARGRDLAVVEGVMGYYDGMGGTSCRASAYEISSILNIPVVLVVNTKGMSLSLAALLKGFKEFRQDSNIRGVIFNQLSPLLYDRIKKSIEEETGIKVYGYLPTLEECQIESRHLGLFMPEEIGDFFSKVEILAEQMEKTIDIEGLLSLAKEAVKRRDDSFDLDIKATVEKMKKHFISEHLKIACAQDEAFCFFYEDNLELLKELGAELIPFSPLRDSHLPRDIQGLLLWGGYPELYAKKLSENIILRKGVGAAISKGLPTMAECGGFLYLGEKLQEKGTKMYFPMAGVIKGRGYDTGRLVRFGYAKLTEGRAFGKDIGTLRAHEFHYYDMDERGEAFLAEKPLGGQNWRCIHSSDTLFAGFPHQYFYGNLKLPEAFLEACVSYKHNLRG